MGAWRTWNAKRPPHAGRVGPLWLPALLTGELALHQIVWQDEGNDKRWVQVMLGGSTADDEVSFSNVNVFANIECFGPFASRLNDRVGKHFWNRELTIQARVGRSMVHARPRFLSRYSPRLISPLA